MGLILTQQVKVLLKLNLQLGDCYYFTATKLFKITYKNDYSSTRNKKSSHHLYRSLT